MFQLDEDKKMIFFRALRINFQVLLLVVAFDDIPLFILLRQPAFDSVWHFRKKAFGIVLSRFGRSRNFTLRRNRKKTFSFSSHLANTENRTVRHRIDFLSVRNAKNASTLPAQTLVTTNS